MTCSCRNPNLYSFASPQSYGLSVLLQLRDQLITLLDDVVVLLVFVIRSVCLDNTLACNAVNGTWDSLGGNKLGKVTVICQRRICSGYHYILTDRGSRRIHQSHWPCSPSRRRGNFGEVVDMLSDASHARTSPGARKESDPE